MRAVFARRNRGGCYEVTMVTAGFQPALLCLIADCDKKIIIIVCVCVCACECTSSQVGCLATVLCARRGAYALDSGGPRDGKVDLCGVRMCTAICV